MKERKPIVVEARKKDEVIKYPMSVYVALLNMLIAGEFLYKCNEYLMSTTAFKQKLKFHLKGLQPELIKMVDEDLDLLIAKDADARVIFNLQDGFTNFISQLHLEKFVEHRPANIAGFGKLVEQFHAMPELVLHRNGIKIHEELETTNNK